MINIDKDFSSGTANLQVVKIIIMKSFFNIYISGQKD